MYQSQAFKIIELMDTCEDAADFADYRRLVNRYLDKLGAEFKRAQKEKATGWANDVSYSEQMRDAGYALQGWLHSSYGVKPFPINGMQGYKLQLIKKLRELGPMKTNEDGSKTSVFGLLECKRFIEQYFSAWC